MSLKVGIIGLPNVGKSALFNAITLSNVEVANYPFATISPNSGIVELKDDRVEKIVKIVNPKKIYRATFEFCDIAGLVKGASKGEGLGNQFLSNIRNVEVLCHVVRCFENNEILHVEGSVNAKRDVEIINMELIFSDIEIVEKRISKIEKKAYTTKDKEALFELDVLNKILKELYKGTNLRTLSLTKDEEQLIKSFNLLTIKPIIYVANIEENEMSNPKTNEHFLDLIDITKEENAVVIPICIQIESELSTLNEIEKIEFLKEYGLEKSGLDILKAIAYPLLGLETFFTAGPKEVKAWTFKKGMKASECAGIIHSDFQRGFIRAEVYTYNDLITYGSENKIKESGKLRVEGKEYLVKDGDIIYFRFNV